jgi:hypothetical protein
VYFGEDEKFELFGTVLLTLHYFILYLYFDIHTDDFNLMSENIIP